MHTTITEADIPDHLPDEDPSDHPRATYAIGDVQGCFDDLLRLLEKLDFDFNKDRLWFTGDLVNRGPNSLEILRFVKGLGSGAITVLGNHDLYLLAVASGAVWAKRKDTINEILDAPDCEELLFWLRHQPLLHHDPRLGFTLIHAGLAPGWDLAQAQACSQELEMVLQNFNYEDFFNHMAGDKPRRWRDELEGWDRLRFIANCFTRLRYCDRRGRLIMDYKKVRHGKGDVLPWFKVPGRASTGLPIIFGHWAKLNIKPGKVPGIFPLDSGCAHRGRFTALRLEDGRVFRIRCYNDSYP